MTITVDPVALARFTSTLFRNCTSDGALCLYVFSHNQSERAISQAWCAPSDLAAPVHLATLAATHPQPAVFCPPVALFGPLTNEAGKRTTAERNVLEAPVITLELDANPADGRLMAESVLGPATMAVASGGLTPDGSAKIHLYWRLSTPARTPEERADLTRVRKLLAAWAGGDASGAPICHPMRWPGSVHRKAAARLATILDEADRDVVLADALTLLTPLVPDLPVARTAVALSGEPLPEGEAARLAATIPNDGPANWAEWSRIGMAFFASTHGSDEGEEAFMAWSARNSAHDADEVTSRWGHWHNSPPTQLTAGTLYHAAGETRGPAPDAASVFADPADLPSRALAEPPTTTAVREAGMTTRAGGTNGLMFVDQQAKHFKGCVYVTSLDRVLTPNGALLNQSRFDARFGGFSFMIDADGKDTSGSAWEAFLKNRAYAPPTADERCFRPALPARALVHEGSRVLVNTYIPINTPRHAGDPAKFLDWLRRCFPDANDRDILLHYLASMVQNVGRKFFWWPVIQSAEGTGKGLLMDLMRHCIGPQYTHLPNTSKMTRQGMNFNGWIEGKLFLGLNEIYSANRRDFLEELKTTVTDTVLPIEGKGIEEATLDNYANGLMFTNHKDGVPVTVDMRRYCVMYMALQSERDIAAAGMDGRYFADLFDWAYGRNAYASEGPNHGLAVINEYLATYPLTAALDPAQLATRAPRSSSSLEAVRASLGRAEQEIIEATEQGQPGFCGGWVSSIMLDRMLEAKRIGIPRNKRREVMQSLGYDWHPALEQGRTNEQVTPDIGKPKLFIREGHLALNFTLPADVARAYSKAQTDAATASATAVLAR